MSDILCVTNRTLCAEDFPTRLERIAAAHPAGIIVREKDLPEAEYEEMARRALETCRTHNVPCVLHAFVPAALRLGADAIHLPLPVLRQLTNAERARFSALGASCHSVADALEAQGLGCTYIIAGHIFATDCKKGPGAPRPGLPAVGLRARGYSGVRHRRHLSGEHPGGARRRRPRRLRHERTDDVPGSAGAAGGVERVARGEVRWIGLARAGRRRRARRRRSPCDPKRPRSALAWRKSPHRRQTSTHGAPPSAFWREINGITGVPAAMNRTTHFQQAPDLGFYCKHNPTPPDQASSPLISA